MKSADLTWPSKASRRRSHGIEYCLVLAITCFAALSTFNAISVQHSPTGSDRIAVQDQ